MKIIRDTESHELDVYYVYHGNSDGKWQKLYLVIPEDLYPGLIAIPESECRVSDSSMDFLIEAEDENTEKYLVHSILHSNPDLYERLIEHEASAMKLFLMKLGHLEGK